MEVTALTSSSDAVRVELTGDAEVVDGDEFREDSFLEAPIRITRADTEGQSLDGRFPQLVFAQNGLVVDISEGWNEAGYALPDAGGSTDAVAEASATTACGTWTTNGMTGFEEYRDARPAGTYDVYAVLPWSAYDGPKDLTGTNGIAVSEPVTMEIPEVEVPDEAPLAVGIRDGYQPPWLDGTSLACGAYASEIPGGPLKPSERSGLRLGVETAADRETVPFSEVTVTFTETAGAAVDTTRTPITLVWLSAGRVVGVGSDVWSEPAWGLRVGAQGETSVVVPVEPDRTCLDGPGRRDAGRGLPALRPHGARPRLGRRAAVHVRGRWVRVLPPRTDQRNLPGARHGGCGDDDSTHAPGRWPWRDGRTSSMSS